MGAFNYLKQIIKTHFKPTWITLDSFGEKCLFILTVFLTIPFIFIFEYDGHDDEEGKWYALYNIIAIWLLVILLAIF